MAAITTLPTLHLIKGLRKRFGAYTFVQGSVFRWSPETATISHARISTQEDIWTLLHEVAHAELSHHDFNMDIELISQEVAAWQHAKETLAPLFGLAIDDDHIDDHLETYRMWLHERSRCPECAHNGLQTTQNTYRCNNCRCLWRVNDARVCALRRTKLI